MVRPLREAEVVDRAAVRQCPPDAAGRRDVDAAGHAVVPRNLDAEDEAGAAGAADRGDEFVMIRIRPAKSPPYRSLAGSTAAT